MPYIRIWVHAVWSTHCRKPVLTKEIREKVFKHIRENAILKNIHIKEINGFSDHLHCLISLSSDQNIATLMNLIKGESSYWINKNKLCKEHFSWQDEYFAVSVSQSGIDSLCQYIMNQENHHQKKTFQQEYDEFMEKYGFDPDNI